MGRCHNTGRMVRLCCSDHARRRNNGARAAFPRLGRFRRDRHRLLSAAYRHWRWRLCDQGLARRKSAPPAGQLGSVPFPAILLDACRLLAGGPPPLETAPSFAEASKLIKEWETKEGLTASEPQISTGSSIARVLEGLVFETGQQRADATSGAQLGLR